MDHEIIDAGYMNLYTMHYEDIRNLLGLPILQDQVRPRFPILSLNGPAGSGKSYLAMELLGSHESFIVKPSGLVYTLMQAVGIPGTHRTYDAYKRSVPQAREKLIQVGTRMRELFGVDFWNRLAVAKADQVYWEHAFEDNERLVIFDNVGWDSDVQFLNQVTARHMCIALRGRYLEDSTPAVTAEGNWLYDSRHPVTSDDVAEVIEFKDSAVALAAMRVPPDAPLAALMHKSVKELALIQLLHPYRRFPNEATNEARQGKGN